ncbi:MAG: ferritin [Puniceicoccales bacterium]|jgi:ferritin|nr:ferritin [Puniceicoccales bacterium]
MKLSKDLEKLIIEQIRNEFESAYIYLGMSAAMGSMSFVGIAEWMRRQAKEEIEHGMKFYDYLVSRGVKVELLPISQASTDYKTPLNAFEVALNHERKVTGLIHKMYDLAVSLKDYESQNMLNWFIMEQIEEENQTQYFVDRLKFAGDDACAILRIDREAGKNPEM